MGKLLFTAPFQTIRRLAEAGTEKLMVDQAPEDILELRERGLDMAIRWNGVDSGPASKGRAYVADQLEKMDRLEEARVFREHVFSSAKRNLGEEDDYTVVAEALLARNLVVSGMPEEARPLVEHVLKVRLRTLGPDHEQTVNAQRQLDIIDEAREW